MDHAKAEPVSPHPSVVSDVRVLFVMATAQEYGKALRSRIAPLICGVGPVEAAATTARCLQAAATAGSAPDLVVSLGSAGSGTLAIGGIYQVGSVRYRDIDASALGFPPGVTPFSDRPATVALATPLDDVPRATLSTGGKVVTGDDFARVETDLADMETYAVLRACEHAGRPMIGIRGVSDGPGDLRSRDDWSERLNEIDAGLARAVDELAAMGSSLRQRCRLR